MRSHVRSSLLALVLVALAACSADDPTAGSVDTTAVSTTSAAVETTAAPTTEPAAEVGDWETITAPADCMCADGGEYRYFIREADPTRVLFFMEGGGACFDARTCSPDSSTFSRGPGDAGSMPAAGVFDDARADNPFAGWTIVFVPYCTGDVHLGNATTDYGNGVVVEHKGFVNASTALATMVERFPDAVQVVVAGESAGSIPSPLFAGLAADAYPTAQITALSDGSGAYPDLPAINAVIGTYWGTMDAVPPWPVNEGMTVDRWSLPGLFVQAGLHAPRIVFARHDYAFDSTQVFFAGLAGIAADELVTLIDQNEADIEAKGVDLLSYISPGSSHTILARDLFYTQTVEGVLLVDWVTALLAGEPSGDVHCVECMTP